MEFNFLNYYKQRMLCVKPFDDGKIREDGKLIYVDHCTDSSFFNNDKLEEEYFSGNGRFYYYDIKLCHTMTRRHYKPFMKELLRRGETENCVLHISNSTVPNQFNSLTSLYDLNYFQVLLGGLLTMEKDLVVELSNKRVNQTPDYEFYKIEEICKMLDNEENVKHYMIREEVYDRELKKDKHAPNGVSVNFRDNYDTLIKEVIRYDSY